MIEPIIILLVILLLLFVIPTNKDRDIQLFNKNFTIGLRGIAIILIVFCHIACCFGSRYFTPIGGPGSAIFILVSGFGINESFKRYSFKDYWKKKIIKVYIPYLIAITLLFIFLQINIRNYLLSLTTIVSPYWFVSYIFKNYLIFYLASKFMFRYRFTIMLIFSFITLLFSNEQEASQAFSFILGVWLSENIYRIRNLTKRNIILIGIYAFIVASLFLILKQLPIIREYSGTYIYNAVQCCIKLPYAIAIIAVIAIKPKIINSKLVIFISGIAYELYLVHMPLYPHINGNILYAISTITISILGAYIFKHLDEFISKKLI